jgi:hypothetical protein
MTPIHGDERHDIERWHADRARGCMSPRASACGWPCITRDCSVTPAGGLDEPIEAIAADVTTRERRTMGAIAYLDADKGVSQLVELVDNRDWHTNQSFLQVWPLTHSAKRGSALWFRGSPRHVGRERLSFCPGNQP